VGGEDHGPLGHFFERLQSRGGINEADSAVGELPGHVLVVNQIAEHGHRLALMLRGSLTESSDRFDHAMAVPARPDFDYLHASIVAVAAHDLDLKRSPRSCSRRIRLATSVRGAAHFAGAQQAGPAQLPLLDETGLRSTPAVLRRA
jgi:hypothetical protein